MSELNLTSLLQQKLCKPVHAAARGAPDRSTADVIVEALIVAAGGGNVGAIALIFELERREDAAATAAGQVPYAMARGTRDFSSTMQLVAGRYDVLCDPQNAEKARDLLARLAI